MNNKIQYIAVPSAGIEAIPMLAAVAVDYSRGKNGRLQAYIRPLAECSNKSRRVAGYDRMELKDAILKAVQKYYYPMNYYKIDGHVIGSNSEHGALKEYWKRCELSDVGKRFDVERL